MRFAQVTGVLQQVDGGYRILVTLDSKTSIQTVRDEIILQLMVRDGQADPEWTVDQLTQETIGTTLAEAGWEAVAHQPKSEGDEWTLPTATYLVRS